MRCRSGYFGLTISLALLAGCGMFPEASFELSPASPIPRWFRLPDGVPRGAVSVTMDDYVDSSGRWARFTLKTKNGSVLLKAKGTMRGLEPLHLGGVSEASEKGYPSYEVVTVNGVSDLVEHRSMEPVFYVVDDAAVRSAFGLTGNQ